MASKKQSGAAVAEKKPDGLTLGGPAKPSGAEPIEDPSEAQAPETTPDAPSLTLEEEIREEAKRQVREEVMSEMVESLKGSLLADLRAEIKAEMLAKGRIQFDPPKKIMPPLTGKLVRYVMPPGKAYFGDQLYRAGMPFFLDSSIRPPHDAIKVLEGQPVPKFEEPAVTVMARSQMQGGGGAQKPIGAE